ncbi:MAG: HNH endonuclease [Planctomycetota bacterium]|nr:MAG: HNH endonuclease [Planctomycetota bacterium]
MNAEHLLQRPTLVLNRRWTPIRTAPVQEAIGLVAKGTAMIIEPESFEAHDLVSWNDVSRILARVGEGLIRSPRLALVPPEVILLKTYEGEGGRAVVFSRKNLFKRDRYTCQYCGIQPGPEELTVDHVVPRSRGGTSTWENCVLACVECNKRKADRTPAQAGLKMRKTPRKPSWKALVQVPARDRRESWDKFLSRAYWEIELEP